MSLFTLKGGKKMKEIKQIILDIKGGKKDEFEVLMDMFMPLINKYAKYLYKDENDDVKAELFMALYDAIMKMKYCDNEGKSIAYIKKTLNLKYLELYHKSKQYHEHMEVTEDIFIEKYSMDENLFEEIEIYSDLEKMIEKYNKQTYEILYSILFEGLTDSQIAKKYKITRQYVNRKRHEVIKLIQEQYITGGVNE